MLSHNEALAATRFIELGIEIMIADAQEQLPVVLVVQFRPSGGYKSAHEPGYSFAHPGAIKVRTNQGTVSPIRGL